MNVAKRASLWPAALMAAVAMLLIASRLDIVLADAIYAFEGGAWTLRHDYFFSVIMHSHAQRLATAFYVVVILVMLVSLASATMQQWRWGLIYVVAASLTAFVLVALGKYALPVACPSNLDRYGGDLPLKIWHLREEVLLGAGCFPAAHATCGFALIPWYFFARYYKLKRPWCYALIALVTGFGFGLVQQIRGAHFLSHDFAAAAVCWATAWAYARLMFLRSSHSQGFDYVAPARVA